MKRIFLLTAFCLIFIGFLACEKKDQPKEETTGQVADTVKEEPKDSVKEEPKEEECITAINVTECPALHLAGIKTAEGYTKEIIMGSWAKLMEWAGKKNLLTPETKSVNIYWDDPKKVEKARFAAAITVDKKVKKEKGIEIIDLKAGLYLVAHFEGTEEQMLKAYDELYGPVLKNKMLEALPLPMYEIVIDYPDKNPEKKFIMDIYIPVKMVDAAAATEEKPAEPAKGEEKKGK